MMSPGVTAHRPRRPGPMPGFPVPAMLKNARINVKVLVLLSYPAGEGQFPGRMRVQGIPGISFANFWRSQLTHRALDVPSTLVSHPLIPSCVSCVSVHRICSRALERREMELGVGCHRISLQDSPSAGFVFRSSHDGVRVLSYTVLLHLFNKPFNLSCLIETRISKQ